MKLKELLKIILEQDYIKIYDNEILVYDGMVKERFRMEYDLYKERIIDLIYSDSAFCSDGTYIIIILK